VQPVLAEGNVEVWLQHLLNKSCLSVHGIIRTAYMAIQDPSFNLIDFLNTFPAQVGFIWLQIKMINLMSVFFHIDFHCKTIFSVLLGQYKRHPDVF